MRGTMSGCCCHTRSCSRTPSCSAASLAGPCPASMCLSATSSWLRRPRRAMHLAELALADRTEDPEFLQREYAVDRSRATHRLTVARITKLSRPIRSSVRDSGSTTCAKCMNTLLSKDADTPPTACTAGSAAWLADRNDVLPQRRALVGQAHAGAGQAIETARPHRRPRRAHVHADVDRPLERHVVHRHVAGADDDAMGDRRERSSR